MELIANALGNRSAQETASVSDKKSGGPKKTFLGPPKQPENENIRRTELFQVGQHGQPVLAPESSAVPESTTAGTPLGTRDLPAEGMARKADACEHRLGAAAMFPISPCSERKWRMFAHYF